MNMRVGLRGRILSLSASASRGAADRGVRAGCVWALILFIFGSPLTRAQSSAVITQAGAGRLEWQAPSNASCTIEWAESPTSTWHSSWAGLSRVVTTNGFGGVLLPMFFRVCYSSAELSEYRFVESLISPYGLVASRPGECYTTVYKNALAALVFIHYAKPDRAERIFSVFQAYADATTPFTGLPQCWNPCTGSPFPSGSNVGDDSFLLLALSCYMTEYPASTACTSLLQKVKLSLRDRAVTNMIAEGAANAYAALKPYAGEDGISQAMSKYRQSFLNDVCYSNVLDHTVRGALVFGDVAGFRQMHRFAATNTWAYDGTTIVRGFADSQWDTGHETNINVEITVQLLLAWSLWRSELDDDLSWIEGETARLSLPQGPDCAGLPYFVSARISEWTPPAYATPIVDPVVFMLFYRWGFNPFSPGQRCAAFGFQ